MIDLHETQNGDITSLELAGKMDASTTPELEALLMERIRSGKKYLSLDFSKVTYLASSGLRMLLVVVRQINDLEGRLVLCGMDQTMRDTLEVTGFLPYFKVAATHEEALQILNS
jgi:anti-anti-sigma factor